MKKFGIMVQIGVSFDERTAAYDFLENVRKFLDSSVPVENFDFHDVKLVFHGVEFDPWGEPKR